MSDETQELREQRDTAWAELRKIDAMLDKAGIPKEESYGFLRGGRALSAPERVLKLVLERDELKLALEKKEECIAGMHEGLKAHHEDLTAALGEYFDLSVVASIKQLCAKFQMACTALSAAKAAMSTCAVETNTSGTVITKRHFDWDVMKLAHQAVTEAITLCEGTTTSKEGQD